MKTRQPEMKNEMNMAELIAAVRAGDRQAFAELYEMTSQDIYRTARAVLRDEEAALDVQQDTYVFAYNHLDQLSDPEKVRPWLRSIAVNRAKSILRKQSPVLFTELENDEGEGLPEQADLSPEASPELSLERKETAELVNEILAELSDGQRAAVAMYYYEQMTVPEIAEALGVAPGTVKSQLARGKKKIEEAVRALEKKGVKLYGLSPVPFLLALMKRQSFAAQQGEAVLAKTMTRTGLAAGAKSAAAAGVKATAAAAEPVAVHVGRSFFETGVGKLLVGVLAAGLIGGGVWAGAKLLDRDQPSVPKQPTETVEAILLSNVSGNTESTEPSESTEPTAPTAHEAPEMASSGTCGDDLTWSIENYDDDEGGVELIISGSGAMYDYDENENRAPWYPYHSQIKELLWYNGPQDGEPTVSAIGSYAFCDCTALTGFGAPETVTVIGAGALKNCTSLTYVYDMHNISTIGDHAFEGCSALTWVPQSQNLQSIGSAAFAGTAMDQIHILNPDVSIEDGAIPTTALICGWTDSTAERYAKDNGCAFERMDEIDLDRVVSILQQSKELQKTDAEPDPEHPVDPASAYHPVIFGNGIYRMNDGSYLMKLVNHPIVTVPAKEMEQMLAEAKQTGKMTVLGQEWTFTESAEEAKACIGDGFFQESEYGWILDEANQSGYAIERRNNQYVFTYSTYGISGIVTDSRNETCLGWITLSGDTAFTQFREAVGEKSTISDFAGQGDTYRAEWYYWSLELDDNGQFVVNANMG